MPDTARALPPNYAHDFELQLLAALVFWPEARRRFRHLNIPPWIFQCDACRLVAGWALAGAAKPIPPKVVAALNAVDTGLTLLRPAYPEWAVRDVERYAVHFANRWIGPMLRWAGEQAEAASPDLPEVIAEVDKIIALFRAERGVA